MYTANASLGMNQARASVSACERLAFEIAFVREVGVCRPPRALITTHVKVTCNNPLSKFYYSSVSLYDTSYPYYGWAWP